jgi:hypothetical protein
MASSIQAGAIGLLLEPRRPGVKLFLGFLVVIGVLNSLIAALLLCRLPAAHAPTLTELSIRAALYVGVGAFAGTAGSWFYWKRSTAPSSPDFPVTFRLFALVCAMVWIWTPAIVLFSRQDSAVAPTLSASLAAVLAVCLRKILPSASFDRHSSSLAWEDRELFSDSLCTARHEAHGYIIALCLYAGVFAFDKRWTLSSGGIFALCASLFVWKLTLAPVEPIDRREQSAGAAFRLACATLLAVPVTLIALLFGIAHRDHPLAVPIASVRATHSNSRQAHSGFAVSGYESIILLPIQQKKQIIAPLPARDNLLAKGIKRPLTIPFTGAYWYFQPPDKQPGPRALQAHGTPLASNIRSNNTFPLVMDAHQNLGTPIQLALCGEIQVGIEGRDNSSGPMAMAVLLTDSALPAKPALYLGRQSILSSETGIPSVRSSQARETLRFFIPRTANIRRFDEITVMFFPEMGNFQTGPKIAIDQFRLIPR